MTRSIVIRDGMFGPGIYGFFREYRWLSNSEPALVYIDDIIWKSTEHYYQAQKSLDPKIKDEIRRADGPKDAKRLGKYIPKEAFDPNWDTNRDQVMIRAIEAKYNIPKYKELLDKTNNLYLEKTNWWNDQYWGVSSGKGLNKLGKYTMLKRDYNRA